MADDLRKRFGRLVAAHRRRRGMTQQKLHEASGISVDMIARIESGATGVRFPNIEKLAGALEVDPAELFTAELPKGALHRRPLTNITSRLAKLSDQDLSWISEIIEAALKPRQ
jgi:transcriptional regulator with XRE-family HTH domain